MGRTRGRVVRGERQGVLHVARVRGIAPGDVEGCSVVDREAEERKAERHADRAVEVDALRDSGGLVVVEAQDDVEGSLAGEMEDGVARNRAADVQSGRPREAHAGLDVLDLLMAE